MEEFLEHESNLRLTKLPVSILKCPVCRDVPVKRKIFQCRNGHIVCEMCSSKLISTPSCPTCRVSIPYQIRNRVLEATLETLVLETRCPYKRRGCSAIIPRNGVTAHLKECSYRPVHICKILGFSNCNFDAFNPHDVVDHLTGVHNVSRETEDFLSFDFAYASNSDVETGQLDLVKLLGSNRRRSRITSDTPTPLHNRFSPSFLFLLKQDENTDGILALCLFIGSSLKESLDFRTAYYFTSTNVPKCVASWPVVWYKDPTVTDEENPGSIWNYAYHISSHSLKIIQGQEDGFNLLIRIRNTEEV